LRSGYAFKWPGRRCNRKGKKKLIRQPERRFYFFLAEKLGKTVAELLAQITSSEITEWVAYFNLKTEGDPVDPKAALTKMFKTKIKKKGR
jgi:hypothetical protein